LDWCGPRDGKPLPEAAIDGLWLRRRRVDMDNRLVNVGFGNSIKADRVLAVANPSSSPLRKLKDEARRTGKLIDMTEGRRTRAIIIMDSGHLVVCQQSSPIPSASV